MVRELAFKDIESVIFEMIDYCEAPNGKAFFENGVWPLALSAKELEATIKTHNEFKEDKAIPEEHSPMRLAVFLLNHYGEYALNGRSITIFGDDPEIASPTKVAQHAHNNTYRLRLKDTQTHETLFPGNPSVDSAPYDFDAEFMKQETLFSNGSVKDTTATAWDSFAFRHNPGQKTSGYRTPQRTFDFKSALWNWKNWRNAHGVDYVLSIDKDLTLVIRTASGFTKNFVISPLTAKQERALALYGILLRRIGCLEGLPWEYFCGGQE